MNLKKLLVTFCGLICCMSVSANIFLTKEMIVGTWKSNIDEYLLYKGKTTAIGYWLCSFYSDDTYKISFCNTSDIAISTHHGTFSIVNNSIVGKTGKVTEIFRLISYEDNQATVECSIDDWEFTLKLVKTADESGINTVIENSPNNQYYSVFGYKTNYPPKGMVVVKQKNGITKK